MYKYIKGYSSAGKKKKLIPFAVTRTDREIMMESEDRERQTP